MPRPVLDETHIHPSIRTRVAESRQGIVREVMSAIEANDIVVVGMAVNPYPKKARKLLEDAKQAFKYLEYGSYLSGWRDRNALKMWTGWPTFPLVFVKGMFLGGADELKALTDSGELKALLERKA